MPAKTEIQGRRKSNRRPTLDEAIRWIADNDETACQDPVEIASLISVVMVSELWGVPTLELAERIAKRRSKDG